MALEDNLISNYRLENVNDNKSTNHLTNNNSVAFNTGKINNAADFGSPNTNKSLHVASDLGITGGAFSCSFWLKLAGEISGTTLWGFFEQVDSSVSVAQKVRYYGNSGSPSLQFQRVKLSVGEQNALYSVSLGTGWNHIVYTYDGTNVRGYLNGSLVAGPTAASGSGSGGGDFFMLGVNDQGQSSYTPDSFLPGLIDEVGTWSRAITADEVTSLYNSGTGMYFNGTVFQAPGTSYTQNCTESVSLTDTLPRGITRPLIETATISDVLVRGVSRILTESATITDTLVRGITRPLTEAVTIADSIIRGLERPLSETVTLTDSIIRSITRNLSETVTLTANVYKGITRILTESISLFDILWQKLGRAAASWAKQSGTSSSWSKQSGTSTTWDRELPGNR